MDEKVLKTPRKYHLTKDYDSQKKKVLAISGTYQLQTELGTRRNHLFYNIGNP